MTGTIFVSYSRKDEATVRDLVRRLKKDGFGIWFDRDRILGGQRWENEIERAIEDARAVIICVSSRWVNDKGYVHKEFRMINDAAARYPDHAIWAIPVRLDDSDIPEPTIRELVHKVKARITEIDYLLAKYN